MKSKMYLVAVAALISAPVFAQSAQAPTELDTCVKAFMSSLSNKYGTAPKLRSAEYVDTGLLSSASRQLALTATDARDHRTLARAVCTVNAQGEVVDLRDEPLL